MSIEKITSLSSDTLSILAEQLKSTDLVFSALTPQEVKDLKKELAGLDSPKIQNLTENNYKTISFTEKEILDIKKKLEEENTKSEENIKKVGELNEKFKLHIGVGGWILFGFSVKEIEDLKKFVGLDFQKVQAIAIDPNDPEKADYKNVDFTKQELSEIQQKLTEKVAEEQQNIERRKTLSAKLVGPLSKLFEQLRGYYDKKKEEFGSKEKRLDQIKGIILQFYQTPQFATWEYLLKERTEIAEGASVVHDRKEFQNKGGATFQSRLWKILDDFIEKNAPQEIKPFCDFLHKLDVYAHNASSERKEQVKTIRDSVYAYLKAWQSNPNSQEAKDAQAALLETCVDTCVKIGATSNLYKVVFPFTKTLVETLTQDDPFAEAVVQALDALEKYKEKTQSLIGRLSTKGTREAQVGKASVHFKIMMNGTPEQKIAALKELITLRDRINIEFEGEKNTSELWRIIDNCIQHVQKTQSVNWEFYKTYSPNEIQTKFRNLSPENGAFFFGERVTTYSDKKIFYSKLPRTQVNYRLPDGGVNPAFDAKESFNQITDNNLKQAFLNNFINTVDARSSEEYPAALKAYRTLIEEMRAGQENEDQEITVSRSLLRRGHQALFLNYVKALFLASEDGIEEKLKIINSPEYVTSKTLLDDDGKASEKKIINDYVLRYVKSVMEDNNISFKEKLERINSESYVAFKTLLDDTGKASEKKIISDCVLNHVKLKSVEKSTTSIGKLWREINSESYRTLKTLLDDAAKTEIEEYEVDIRASYNNALTEAVVDTFDPANPLAWNQLRGKDEPITMENIGKLSFSEAQQHKIKQKIGGYIEAVLKDAGAENRTNAVYSVLDLYNNAFAFLGENVPSVVSVIQEAWKTVSSEPTTKNRIVSAIRQSLVDLLQNKGSDQRCAEILDTLLKVYPDAKAKFCQEIKDSVKDLIEEWIWQKDYSTVSLWQENLSQNKFFKEQIDSQGEINTMIEKEKENLKKKMDIVLLDTDERAAQFYKEIVNFVGEKELFPLAQTYIDKQMSEYMNKSNYAGVVELINLFQGIIPVAENSFFSKALADKVATLIQTRLQKNDYAGIKTLFDFFQLNPSLALGVNTPFWEAQRKMVSNNIIQKASALITNSQYENYSDLNKLFETLEGNKLYGDILHKLDIKAAIMSEFRVHVQKFLAEKPDKETAEKFCSVLLNVGLIEVEEISKSVRSYLSEISQEKIKVENNSLSISQTDEKQIINEKKIEENKNTENSQKLLQEFQKFVEQMQIGEKDPEGITSKFLKEMTLDFATKLGSASLKTDEDDLLKSYLLILENVVSKLSQKHYCLKVVMEIFLQQLKYTKKMPNTSCLSGAQEFIFNKFKNLVDEISSAKPGNEKWLENMNSIVHELCVFIGENAQHEAVKSAIDGHILSLIEQFISWVKEGNLSPEEETAVIEKVVKAFQVFDPGQKYYQERKLARVVYPALINYLTNEKALSPERREQTMLETLGFSGKDGMESFKYCLGFLSDEQRDKLRSTLSERYKELSEMYKDARVPPKESSSWHTVYGKGFFASFKQDKLPPSDTWRVLFALNDALGDKDKGEKKHYLNMDSLVLQAMNAIRKLTSVKATRPNSELAPWFENAVNIVVASGNSAYLDELVWRLQAMVYEYADEQLKNKDEGFNAERSTQLHSCISTLLEQLPKDLTAQVSKVFIENDYKQANSTEMGMFALSALYLQQIEKSSEVFQKMLVVFYPEAPKNLELLKAKRHAFYEWRSQVLAGNEVDLKYESFSALTLKEKEFCKILLAPLKGKGGASAGVFTQKNVEEFTKKVEESLNDFLKSFSEKNNIGATLQLGMYERFPEELQQKSDQYATVLVKHLSLLISHAQVNNYKKIESELDVLASIPTAGTGVAMLHLLIEAYLKNADIGNFLLNMLKGKPQFEKYKNLKELSDFIQCYLDEVFFTRKGYYVDNEKIKEMLLHLVEKYPQCGNAVMTRCEGKDEFKDLRQKIAVILLREEVAKFDAEYFEPKRDTQKGTRKLKVDEILDVILNTKSPISENSVAEAYYLLKGFVVNKGEGILWDNADVKSVKTRCAIFPYAKKLEYLFSLKEAIIKFQQVTGAPESKKSEIQTLQTLLQPSKYLSYFGENDIGKAYSEQAVELTKELKKLKFGSNEDINFISSFEDIVKGAAAQETSDSETRSTDSENNSPVTSGKLPQIQINIVNK